MKSPSEITYSDGSKVSSPVVCIWEDNHTECRGNWFRAFWCASPDADTGSPVISYGNPGGSQRTIRAAVSEVRRLYPDARCYRNGKEVYPLPAKPTVRQFVVASRSSNTNAFGPHGLILVAKSGEAWEVARHIPLEERNLVVKGFAFVFELLPSGMPNFRGCEIPRRLPNAPAAVVAEVWGGAL